MRGCEDWALPSLPQIPLPYCRCPQGGTYASLSHSQLPLNPLKPREYPGRSFYKAERGTCPTSVTSTQARRLFPAEGRVGSIGRWRTPSLGGLYPSIPSTLRMGGQLPPPQLQAPCLGWGWEALNWHLAGENLILGKTVWEPGLERGTDTQTEGDIYLSRTNQVCIRVTGPESSLAKWDPWFSQNSYFPQMPDLFSIRWRLDTLYMTYFFFSPWGFPVLSWYWNVQWSLVHVRDNRAPIRVYQVQKLAFSMASPPSLPHSHFIKWVKTMKYYQSVS